MSKNGASAAIAPNELQRLGLSSNDLFAITLDRSNQNTITLGIEVNGKKAKVVHEVQLTLSDIQFEQGKSYNAVHESGKVIPCREVN
ncbi:MAG: hypothetical protein J5968_01020, partial [Oscillospiraceae bacterium]|nr:hypothetical protein [Oscillospiraceae bacterium]